MRSEAIIRHSALMSTSASLYHRHRFPTEIISHYVWLYFRFALSFRDVEELFARGVVLTYETVREWCLKFGQTYANNLRRKSPRPGDTWHLQCGEGRIAIQCRTLPGKVSEQSGREFTSVDQVARACDETVQISGSRSAITVGLRNHCFSRPTRAAPLFRRRL